MIKMGRIVDLYDHLDLGTMATHLPRVAEEAARNELSFTEFFERLLHVEQRERQERSRTLLMKPPDSRRSGRLSSTTSLPQPARQSRCLRSSPR